MTERRAINPWTWQDRYCFVQANEIKDATRVLVGRDIGYCNEIILI
ncbi:MAG: hypothetical protein WBX01_00765 [Nitrososphaeraceae archaeon]